MRRALFNRTIVLPYTPGEAINRDHALSIVLGVACSAATDTPTIKVTLTECDTEDGTFTAVKDELAVPTVPVELEEGVADMVNIDVVGCKQFVKITPMITGEATCAYAIALGDFDHEPPLG